ncbi:MAG: VCBS repeat-containing protein [Planctomycetota bacterium]|nr:VCBS repeat-containing protein [Planctomycetota bacterium]
MKPILAVFLAVLVSAAASRVDDKVPLSRWTHFTIANPLPGNAWGTGDIGLADFDEDGKPDIALSRREPAEAYWFQHKDDATWVRHSIGKSDGLKNALGAVAVDVDGDGHVDYVSNKVWFRNPGNLKANPDAPWEARPFEGTGHDIIAVDVNGDGRPDIVCYDGAVLCWFDTARNLQRTIISQGHKHHGGLAPRGFGDINGDGKIDLVIPGLWFQNPGDGRGEWQKHPWPHKPIPSATYGTSARCWVADVNRDGRNDIVYSDCDTGMSHVYWVENLGNDRWEVHPLPDPPTAAGDVPGTGSFHSLAVADFDGDGDLDIFAGEQEDPDERKPPMLSMKPKGLKPRGIIWENSGGANPSFRPVVIHVGNPGWHDVVVADIDGDGDPDLVSKIWNKDGPSYHADYWRNDIRGAAPTSP